MMKTVASVLSFIRRDIMVSLSLRVVQIPYIQPSVIEKVLPFHSGWIDVPVQGALLETAEYCPYGSHNFEFISFGTLTSGCKLLRPPLIHFNTETNASYCLDLSIIVNW